MKEFFYRVELNFLLLTFCTIVLPISIFSQDTTCGIVWGGS